MLGIPLPPDLGPNAPAEPFEEAGTSRREGKA